MPEYAALPGIYNFIFVWLEPLSEIGPIIGSLMYGPSWFYNELVPPTGPPPSDLDPRAIIAVWQLTICYLLLFLTTSIGYRAIRDTLPGNPAGQERLTGVFLSSLCVADISHIFLTFRSLPQEYKYNPLQWNTTTHGNLTFVLMLHIFRISWFFGIGRKRHYYGQKDNIPSPKVA